MEDLESDRSRFLELVQYWHRDHPRLDQVQHCVSVMEWVESALKHEPGSVPKRREMILAALGHDLYEDTKIDPAQIVADFGEEVDRLIESVTERNGVMEFVERVAGGPEEARLIKLADGISN